MRQVIYGFRSRCFQYGILQVIGAGKGDTSTISAVYRMRDNPEPSEARDVFNSHACLDIFSF